MHFAIYNLSTAPQVSRGVLLCCCAAITIQLNRDLQGYNETGGGSSLGFYPSKADIPKADIQFEITDDIPEAPGAIAYHTTDVHGRPLCKLSWNACVQEAGGDLAQALKELTTAISHECVEAEGNPYVRGWSDGNDGKTEFCEEWCDPVQDQWYEIPVEITDPDTHGVNVIMSIAVSDFVTTRWFEPSGPGPYNFLHEKQPVKPLHKTAGGYIIKRTGGPAGDTIQDFGETMSESAKASKTVHGRVARWGVLSAVDDRAVSLPDPV
jgi:hypothetical protein